MADGAPSDVLGQKAQAAQRAFEARGMSPSKALRRALSRTADVLWDLALVCQSVHCEALDQDGVIDWLTDDNLLLLLDGPGGALGLMAIDRAVMTGVIEVQTIAQVTTLPPEARVLTTTDAAMMAPLVDGALTRFAQNLDGDSLQAQIAGFQFGAMVEDPRAASLLLEAPRYHGFRVELDLALGRRKGALTLFLPERPKALKSADGQPDAQRDSPHKEMMQRLPIRLDVVLGRISMPLNRVQALRAGDVLPLRAQNVDEVQIVAARGKLVAKGKLGQLHNMRAVRLTWPQAAARAGSQDMANSVNAAAPAKAVTQSAPPTPEPTSLPNSDEMPLPVASVDPGEDLPDLPPLDLELSEESFDEERADREFADLADLPLEFDDSLLGDP